MAELEEVETDRTSPFHPDNVGAFTLLTLLQIRDIMAALLQAQHPAGYSQVREAHRSGQLLLEPPFLLPQGEEGAAE